MSNCSFKNREGLQDVSARGPLSTAYRAICKQLTKAPRSYDHYQITVYVAIVIVYTCNAGPTNVLHLHIGDGPAEVQEDKTVVSD